MDIDSLARAMESGAATVREQRLLALGIAIALRGDECIVRHVRDAFDAGIARGELADAVKIALTIGGGSAGKYAPRLDRAADRVYGEPRGCEGARSRRDGRGVAAAR